MADDDTTSGNGNGGTGSGAGEPQAAAGTQPAQQEPQTATGGDSGDEPLAEGGKKALDAERKARRDLERRLKEFEDREKTELQRATDDRDQHRARADEAEVKLTRYEVAAAKGLDTELADLLPAGSREDMEAAADRLVAKTSAAEPRRPRPDPTQANTSGRRSGDMNSLIAGLRGRG